MIASLLSLITLFSSVSAPAFVCDSSTPIQTVRDFYYMAMGSPSSDEYHCFTQNSATIESMVTQAGLVGDINTMRATLSTSIKSKLGNNMTCDNLPTSGSIVIGSGKTVYFEPAQNTIPATFPGGGATYQKRLRYVNTNTAEVIKFEFNCSNSRIMAHKKRTLTNGDMHIVTFYDDTGTTKYIDFYFYDPANFNNDNINMAIAIRIDSTTQKFQFWQARTGFRANVAAPYPWSAYRFSAHVNYTTQETTIHYHDVSGSGWTSADYTTAPDVNSTVVTAVNAPNAGNSDDLRMGCAADFSIHTNTIGTNAACAGLALSVGPNTAFGDTFSLQSVEDNLRTRILAIP